MTPIHKALKFHGKPKDSSLNVNRTSVQLNTKPLKLNQALEAMKKKAAKE